jgi:transcriptional regulator with XRE-family HTH domain
MFGDRLTKLRNEKNISMKQCAYELDIPYTTYVSYEKNEREPKAKQLMKIANYFDVSLDFLLGRTKSQNIRYNLASNLNKLLTENKSFITKKQLSQLLGVTPSAITNWTKGSNSPDIELLVKICDIFKIDINELIGISSDNFELSLNNHEKQVISAYRKKTDLQKAIDILLNIE